MTAALIILAIIAAVLAVALVAQAREHNAAILRLQEEHAAERARFVTALLSRNVAEFALADAKMNSQVPHDRDRYRDTRSEHDVVGV